MRVKEKELSKSYEKNKIIVMRKVYVLKSKIEYFKYDIKC